MVPYAIFDQAAQSHSKGRIGPRLDALHERLNMIAGILLAGPDQDEE